LFFSSAAVSNQFPVLARLLHISDRMSSLLLSLTIAGVGVGSVLMSRTTRWHDRIAPLLGAMLVTVGALALLSVATSPLAFGIGLLTTGLARAVVYSASLYYGLRSHLPKGTATSIHETLIGAAFTFGPLIAGGMAQAFNPRAPFAFCLVTVLGVIVMTVVAWQRRRKTA
jgi:MFS family permease